MIHVKRVHAAQSGSNKTSPLIAKHPPVISIAIGGRRYGFGLAGACSLVVATAALLAWGAASASYILFRDDALAALARHQSHLQVSYQGRIEELTEELRKLTSRKLLNQELVERKIEDMARRQASLEQRHGVLAGLMEPQEFQKLPQRRASLEGDGTPLGDTIMLQPVAVRTARLESRIDPATTVARSALPEAGEAGMRLAGLLKNIDQLEKNQRLKLEGMEDHFERRIQTMRSVMGDLGLDQGRASKPSASSGMGGPYVPVAGAGSDPDFSSHLARVSAIRTQMKTLETSLAKVPLARPIDQDAALTSNFGVRSDPFLGRPAMHTGVDWRAGLGEPVRVTASGKVVFAGQNGGYGLMIDVDHGDGYVTRYAHLSAFDVAEGQKVQIGDIIGRVGSTGRSTGAHLHYETRIHGEAVDPQKFLRAGVRLRRSA